MKVNNELRKELVGVLEKRGGDVLSRAAGSTLGQVMPRGLQGALGPLAGGIGFAVSPASLPLILLVAATSSPRLAAEAANIAGRVNARMMKANQFTPEIQNSIRLLLQEVGQGEEKKKAIQVRKIKGALTKPQSINIKKIAN